MQPAGNWPAPSPKKEKFDLPVNFWALTLNRPYNLAISFYKIDWLLPEEMIIKISETARKVLKPPLPLFYNKEQNMF